MSMPLDDHTYFRSSATVLPAISTLPLPHELMLEALVYLDALELVRCRLVCRRLASLIDTTPRLQYTLELLLAGMVDANSNGSVTSALAKLRELRRAWQEFRLSHQITLPCFHGRTPLACDYKVSAGVLGRQVGQRGLKFHLLSSSPQGIDAQEWDIEDLGFEVYHFVLDVAQDLLIATELQTEAVDVIVGMRVHLLSLHTGKPHPHAQVPVFTVDYSDNDGRIGVNAECCGDSLGVIVTTEFFDSVFELLVWNWKTGQLRLDIYNMMYDAEPWLDKFIGANSFHFLDADHVLVPTIEENKGINSRAVLHMFDCREISPERKALRDLISCGTAFILPPLAQNFEYTQFYCAANIPPPLAPTSPFHPDPALRIAVFQVGITDLAAPPNLTGTSYFYLFVRSETFLRHEKYGPTWGGFSWEKQWGRDALLIRQPGERDIWLVHEVSHNKCLVMEGHVDEPENEDSPIPIMIYEFPAAEVLRHDLASRRELDKWECVMKPQTLIDERMWEQKQVDCGLSFRKVDTGLIAHPVDVPGEMKEHALTGDLYLQYNDVCWRAIQLPTLSA